MRAEQRVSKLTKTNQPISVDVEQLEGRLVEGVRIAEEAFERLKFRIGDVAIFACVDDGGQESDGIRVEVAALE